MLWVVETSGPDSGHGEMFESDVVRYVLSDFTGAEEAVINPVIAVVGEAALCFLSEDISRVMNRYN